jgi:hypothetical protein
VIAEGLADRGVNPRLDRTAVGGLRCVGPFHHNTDGLVGLLVWTARDLNTTRCAALPGP